MLYAVAVCSTDSILISALFDAGSKAVPRRRFQFATPLGREFREKLSKETDDCNIDRTKQPGPLGQGGGCDVAMQGAA